MTMLAAVSNISTAVRDLVAAWHDSPLPDRRIADLGDALNRYDELASGLQAYRAQTANVLADVADDVVAGRITFGDAVAEYTRRTAGQQRTAHNAGRLDAVLFDQCRRHARRAIEAQLGRINWAEVLSDPAAGDDLRRAVHAAGLAPS